MAIMTFRGQFFFLSNFSPAPLIYQGLRFKSSESAFQAAKCPERIEEFCNLTSYQAKRLGNRVELRPDWDSVKLDVMYQVCKAKFEQNPDLLERLLATEDEELIEWNDWHDTFWGVCDGVGENNLGKTLMRIREEFKRKDLI